MKKIVTKIEKERNHSYDHDVKSRSKNCYVLKGKARLKRLSVFKATQKPRYENNLDSLNFKNSTLSESIANHVEIVVF